MHRPRTSPLIAVLLAAAIAPAAAATTYVMVSDRHLVAGSAAVVEARVLSAEAETLGGLPATRYRIEVEELLSGDVPGRQLVVDVPGGTADGVGLRLDGMPNLAAGERVLLFLDSRDDGSYRVTQLLLGVFRERFDAGRRVWVRDHLGQARELAASGTGAAGPGSHRPRDAEAFGLWIEETGRGGEPEADYFVAAGEGAAPRDDRATGAYRLSQSDHPLRWFGFDDGEPVRWKVAPAGQPGYTPEATVAAFRAALAAWNHDPESIVDLRYDALGDGRGFQFRDGVNSLLFADADGTIGEPYDCGAGGILAVGGPWYDPAPRQDARGLPFQAILEAEIVTNQGIECYLATQADPARALGQLLAHELGHTLGIAHSCSGGDCTAAESDALMYPYFHADGRGAALAEDDRAAVRHLYPGRSGPDELGEGPGECSDPEVLCLHDGRFRVEVGWRSQHQGGREGRGRAVPGTGESGYFWFFNEDNVELVVKVLDGRPVNGSFWVFYGGLSDVEYEIEVWDTATGVRRAYRNEPGELCGDADTMAFADAGAAAQAAVVPAAAANSAVPPASVRAAASQGACVPSATTLCLQDGRFAVTVDWRNQRTGNTGSGQVLAAATGGEKTGYFWFFRPQNVELVVKLIDGREVNGKHWFFYGALSDVEYEIEVRDTLLGGTRIYRNEPGSICGRGDTAAF